MSDGTLTASLPAFSITVTNTNDAPTGLPTISGIPTQRETLTAVTAAISDADGLGSFSYQWQAGTDDISGATDTSLELTQAEVGKTITVKVSYTDQQGADETLTSIPTNAVTNTNDAPTITGTPDTMVAQDAEYSFTPTGVDIDGDMLTYSINTQPGWAGFSTTTGALSGTPTNNDIGITENIVISVSDGTLAASLAAFSITVTNVNDTPTITGTPPDMVAEDSAYSFMPGGGDIDAGDTPTYTLSNNPDWLMVDTATGTLSGTPANADVGENRDIVLTITSGGETAALTFSIEVTNVNDAPTITGTPPDMVAEDSPYSFEPVGADIDAGDMLEYSIESRPSWAIFSTTTGVLSGTPTNAHVGITENIVITVSDGTLTASLPAFSITVTNTNDAPTGLPTISGTPTQGATLTTVTAAISDADGLGSFSYQWQAGTDDISGATDTSLELTQAEVGKTITVKVSYTDQQGADETLTSIPTNAVTNTNDAPTITGTPDTTVAQDAEYSFTPTGVDIDGDMLTYSINTQPGWAGFSTTTGALSGAPTNNDIGTTIGIVITVTDGTLTASLPAFSITVTNVNDAPTITGTPPASIAEDSAYSFTPGGGDIDAGDTPLYSLSNNPSWLMVNDATGALSGTPRNNDVGEHNDIVLTITAGEETAALTFSIEVINTNDAPTITGTPPTSIAEDSAYSFTPGGGDVDAGDTPLYSLSNNPSWLMVNADTGALSGTPTNDDIGITEDIVISVTDNIAEAVSLPAFSITVTNTNDAPTITGTPPDMVAEDTAYSFMPGGGDIDANDTPSYSLSNNPDWLSVDTATGTLSGTPANTDVGTNSDIVLTITTGGETAALTFSIEVTNTNDAPTITGTPPATIAEDSPYSFEPVGADIDAGDMLEYSIESKPSWAIFSTTTGVLSGTPTNAHVGITENIVITVSDGTLTASLPAFSITVTNTNDAPTGLPTISGTPTQRETLTADTSTISDADGLGSFSYQWQAGTDDIDSATSATFVLTQAQVGQTITVKVSYTDDGNTAESLTSAATAAVTNTNDAPTGLPTISGTPTQRETLTADTSTISDADGLGSFSYQWQAGTDDINGATDTSLELTQAEVGKTITVKVSYTDQQGADETLTSVPTNAVTNTNDAPTITGTPDTTVAQDAEYSFTPTGADIDGDILTYSINTQPSWADFITTTGALSGAPTNNDIGTTIGIVITVTDGTLTASLPAFSITVTNVNDAPTITGTPPTSIAEDSAYSFTPGGGDIDAGDTLEYSIESKPTWATFNEETGALSGTPTNNDIGTTTGIVISVTDGAATASLTAFDLEVTNVNDAPTITGTPPATIAEDSAYSFTPGGGDVDAGDTLVYSLSDNPTWLMVNADTGALSGTPTNADVGTTTGIVLTITSGGQTDTLTFSIEVTNTNDAPTITGTPPATIAEDTAYSFMPGGGDIDANDTPSYSLSNNPDWLSVDTATGTLSGTPANTDVGTNSDIVLTITSGGETAALTFSIEVTNTNDAPTITGTPPDMVAEDTAYTFMPGGGDIDANDTPSYSLSNNPDWLSVDTATGTLSGTPANTDVGTHSDIVLTITSGGETAALTFSIEVTNTNDAPTITGTPPATIAEDSPYSFEPVGADIDAGDMLEYSIESKPSWAIFSTTTGVLSGTPTNAHVGITENIVITVSDGTLTASLPAFSITVTNTNDAPTGLPTISGTPTQRETLTADTSTISDADGLGSFSYQWQAGTDDINGATDTSLELTQAEVGKTITVKVSYTDQQGADETLTSVATAAVTNTNDAPTITGTPGTTVAQDNDYLFAPVGADIDGDILTYSINTQPSWADFITTTGALSGAPTNNDIGTTIGIVITVTDGTLTASLPAFSITVTNVNDAPTITGTPPASIAEDSVYSFTPGGGDIDAGDTPLYSLSDNPAWLMVNADTGALSGTPTNADVGTTTGIVLTITAGGQTDTLTFSIEVTNTNDAPTITGTPPDMVAEDSAYSFTPGGGDIDAGDTPSYSLSNNPSWLMVNDATGALSGTPRNNDVGEHNDIVLTITAGEETAALTFSIEVINTNDAPTITGTPPASVAQDTAYSFTPGGGDVDAGDIPIYSLSNNPTWLMVNIATGELSGTPTNADVGLNSRIVLSVASNEASATLLFDITVTNRAGNLHSNTAGTVTISGTAREREVLTATVTDADGIDGVSITYQWQAGTDDISGADEATFILTQAEVGKTITVKVSYTDQQGADETLTSVATAAVTNTNDAPTGLPTISGIPTQRETLTADTSTISDADGLGSFSYQWQAGTDDIDSATSATFVLTQAQVGQTITVKVSYTDDGNTAESLTSAATAAVTNTNDDPTGLPTISGTPTQGQTLTAVTAAISDADGLGSFSYQWQAGTDDISGATDTSLELTQAEVGKTITVKVSYTDQQGADETLTSIPTNAVTNTNDAPTITGTPDTTVAQDAEYSFTPTGVDIDGDMLTYSINTQPGWAGFSTTTGALSGTPTNNDIGITENIVISVSDGTLAASLAAFSITVTNVNDTPTITGTPPATIAEDSAYSFMPGGGDIDANDTPSYSLSNNPDWLSVDTATGALSGTPTNADVGTTTGIVLTITSGGQTDTLTFSIEVTNTNDAPTITGTPPATIAEDSAYSFTPGGGDVDAGDTPLYSLSDNPAWLMVNADTGTSAPRPMPMWARTETLFLPSHQAEKPLP